MAGRSAVLLLAALAAVGWGVSQLETVSQLRATERAEEFHPASGTLVAEHGFGPLRIDVLQLADDRTVRVSVPPSGHGIGSEQRELRVSADGGAYYPSAPPRDGLWLLFAAVAAVSLLAGLVLAVVAIRPLGVVIFGQRDPDAKTVGWLPGNGGHGGPGGQAPPYVPYSPDWDPKRRRSRR